MYCPRTGPVLPDNTPIRSICPDTGSGLPKRAQTKTVVHEPILFPCTIFGQV
jgi:hypothetical protein